MKVSIEMTPAQVLEHEVKRFFASVIGALERHTLSAQEITVASLVDFLNKVALGLDQTMVEVEKEHAEAQIKANAQNN